MTLIGVSIACACLREAPGLQLPSAAAGSLCVCSATSLWQNVYQLIEKPLQVAFFGPLVPKCGVVLAYLLEVWHDFYQLKLQGAEGNG